MNVVEIYKRKFEPLYLYFCSILVTCRPVGSLCLKICNFENVTASGKSRLWKK